MLMPTERTLCAPGTHAHLGPVRPHVQGSSQGPIKTVLPVSPPTPNPKAGEVCVCVWLCATFPPSYSIQMLWTLFPVAKKLCIFSLSPPGLLPICSLSASLLILGTFSQGTLWFSVADVSVVGRTQMQNPMEPLSSC